MPYQIGERRDIVVAMDWTDFDHDDQATLALHLVTGHGRALPLIWITVWKDELKDHRNDFEDACLRRLAELVPPGCRAGTILADRWLRRPKAVRLSRGAWLWLCDPFPWQHPRHRRGGEPPGPPPEWVGKGGRCPQADGRSSDRARPASWRGRVTSHAKDMKEPWWCLATSERDAAAAER